MKGLKRAEEKPVGFGDGRRQAEALISSRWLRGQLHPSAVPSTDQKVSVFFSPFQALHSSCKGFGDRQ
jgi:hypothetical protein